MNSLEGILDNLFTDEKERRFIRMFCRVALTGTDKGPPLDAIVDILGWGKTIKRINKFAERVARSRQERV